MGWIVAIVVTGLIIGGLVGGTVLHPFLYGLFVAAVVIVPLWLFSAGFRALFGSLFGGRR